MKKYLPTLILLVVIGCSVTMVSVKNSDQTTISTSVKNDSLDLGDWNWDEDNSKDKSNKDSIK